MACGPHPWRHRFIDLAQSLQRIQGEPETPFDPSLLTEAVEIELQVGARDFSIFHADPNDATGQMLLQCCFGEVPDTHQVDSLRRALALNRGLARSQSGMFALDARRHTLVYSLLMPMGDLSAEQMLDAMREIAESAGEWRRVHPLDLH